VSEGYGFFIGEYMSVRIRLRQIPYRLHLFHQQVLSGDLRPLAGGFNLRKATYLLLRLCEDSGNLTWISSSGECNAESAVQSV